MGKKLPSYQKKKLVIFNFIRKIYMKYIIILLMLLLTFSSFGALVSKKLKCSQAGTDVLFVNGISWGPETVEYILYKQIEPSFNEKRSYLDNKTPAGTFVTFKSSYNHSDGFLRDMLESSAQKLSQNFKIPLSVAFVPAYFALYKGIVAADFIDTIIQDKRLTFKNVLNYLEKSLDPNTLDKMIQNSFTTNQKDARDLKSSISSTLLNGKKLILITESQGNLFGKQAILDFQNGELLKQGSKTAHISNYLDVIGQLQIAPPTGSSLPKNKVVLNDKDIINLVFFEKPNSNFTLIPPFPDLREVFIDRLANHFITSTYLNDENMTTGNLSQLREFTMQSLVDVASLLESNCLKAVIKSTVNNLTVNFDSTDPDDPIVTGLTYLWDFGDGKTATTSSKTLSHTYAAEGSYNVSLTVKDSSGANDSVTANVNLNSNINFEITQTAASSKYKYIILDSSDENINGQSGGIFWSQSVTLLVTGKIGESVSLWGTVAPSDMDCGEWSHRNFFNVPYRHTCVREAGQPVSTTMIAKQYHQCGGYGCPYIITLIEVVINTSDSEQVYYFYPESGGPSVDAGEYHIPFSSIVDGVLPPAPIF
jgi:PKD repeat protein